MKKGTEELLIEVENLTKMYGRKKAIDRISFRVRKGEVVGFLGPNGAGKSTTMRILCGLLPGSSGQAQVCGIPLATGAQEVKKYIGYMPENNPLPSELRVDEYLRFRGMLKGLVGTKLRQRIDEVLDLCDLERTAGKRIIGNLSKGYRQRVGIAESLVGEPKLVIMDEPTIGLDPHQVKIIHKLIDRLRDSVTFFISSHVLSEVETSCDRVIIINRGHLVAEGTLPDLRKEFTPKIFIEIYAAGKTDYMEEEIRKLDPEIEKVEEGAKDAEGFRWLVFRTQKGNDLTEQVANLLIKSGKVRIREIRTTLPGLKDIFMRATQRSWEIETPFGPITAVSSEVEQDRKPELERANPSGKEGVEN
ncbi:MAG: ABC transporter ATP-binding protein, partial [Opitutales bacterium]